MIQATVGLIPGGLIFVLAALDFRIVHVRASAQPQSSESLQGSSSEHLNWLKLPVHVAQLPML